jgi:hypothetical protein
VRGIGFIKLRKVGHDLILNGLLPVDSIAPHAIYRLNKLFITVKTSKFVEIPGVGISTFQPSGMAPKAPTVFIVLQYGIPV